MLEQLNSNNLQKVSAELATGFNRLQALMQIGESRTAQVVAVVAQPPRNAAPPKTAAQATRAPVANPAGTDSSRVESNQNRAATSPQSQSATTAYRIRVRVQGQMLELVSPRPLPTGSQVELTRTADNRLLIQAQGGERTPAESPPARPTPTTPPPPPTSPNARGETPARTDAGANRSVAPPPSPSPQATLSRSEQQRLETLIPRPNQPVPARVVASRPAETPPSQPAPSGPARTAGSQPPSTTAPSAPVRPLPFNAPTAPATDTAATQQRVQLSIGRQTLEILAPRPIPVGTEVRISRQADGQVTLHLPPPRAQAVEIALRQHLPQQQPPNELFNLLSQLNTQTPLRQSQPLLMSLVSLLLGRTLTSPSQPDPEGLRQQVHNGGTLMEGKLARGEAQNLPQDQKALLLKLAQQLQQPASRELPTTLSDRLGQLTQQAVSRVITNQIHSLGNPSGSDQEAEPARALVVDVPVQGQQGRHETVQLRISEQSGSHRDQPDSPRRWQVELAFRIEELPPMSATLTLEQDRVSLVWQGESGTRSLLQPHLGGLQQRLEGLGLEVEVMGVRERRNPPSAGSAGSSLIDVET